MADIDVEGLVKRYGELVAVDGVSFAVERGEIFGMLGPNGAGKTTTLEIIEGLRFPDAGRVSVLGTDVLAHPGTVKERIGVQLQATALPEFTPVHEAIEPSAPSSASAAHRRGDRGGQPRGEGRRLHGRAEWRPDVAADIALALINDPDLVFFDEPTTGLDPQARLNIWEIVEGVRKRGKTVVLTTHYMEEAERLCDRVAVIDRGRIVALDTPGTSSRRTRPGPPSSSPGCRARRRHAEAPSRCGARGRGRPDQHLHPHPGERPPRAPRPRGLRGR